MSTTTETKSPFLDFRPLPVKGIAVGDEFRRLAPMYRDYHKNDCPDEFKSYDGTFWNAVVSEWFFSGLGTKYKFAANDGIDEAAALQHVQAILSSFEPDHGSKEAIAAFLLSLWFRDFTPDPDARPQFVERLNRLRPSMIERLMKWLKR